MSRIGWIVGRLLMLTLRTIFFDFPVLFLELGEEWCAGLGEIGRRMTADINAAIDDFEDAAVSGEDCGDSDVPDGVDRVRV